MKTFYFLLAIGKQKSRQLVLIYSNCSDDSDPITSEYCYTYIGNQKHMSLLFRPIYSDVTITELLFFERRNCFSCKLGSFAFFNQPIRPCMQYIICFSVSGAALQQRAVHIFEGSVWVEADHA